MNCPYCTTMNTTARAKKTVMGYRTFECRHCQRTLNERTGTPFKHLEYPTASVLLVVFWQLRYKLSLRDLAEMFLERGGIPRFWGSPALVVLSSCIWENVLRGIGYGSGLCTITFSLLMNLARQVRENQYLGYLTGEPKHE